MSGIELAGWERGSFSAAGLTRPTYRRGTGPGVVVIHEMHELGIEPVFRERLLPTAGNGLEAR